MSSDAFQVLDIQTAGGSLEHLHAHVVRCSGRIEIHCPSGKVCVLISKSGTRVARTGDRDPVAGSGLQTDVCGSSVKSPRRRIPQACSVRPLPTVFERFT